VREKWFINNLMARLYQKVTWRGNPSFGGGAVPGARPGRACELQTCGPTATACAAGRKGFTNATIIYNYCFTKHDYVACGETFHSAGELTADKERENIMGDKSPKANQKKSGQKQTKASSANAKKIAAVAAKSAVKKK